MDERVLASIKSKRDCASLTRLHTAVVVHVHAAPRLPLKDDTSRRPSANSRTSQALAQKVGWKELSRRVVPRSGHDHKLSLGSARHDEHFFNDRAWPDRRGRALVEARSVEEDGPVTHGGPSWRHTLDLYWRRHRAGGLQNSRTGCHLQGGCCGQLVSQAGVTAPCWTKGVRVEGREGRVQYACVIKCVG